MWPTNLSKAMRDDSWEKSEEFPKYPEDEMEYYDHKLYLQKEIEFWGYKTR